MGKFTYNLTCIKCDRPCAGFVKPQGNEIELSIYCGEHILREMFPYYLVEHFEGQSKLELPFIFPSLRPDEIRTATPEQLRAHAMAGVAREKYLAQGIQEYKQAYQRAQEANEVSRKHIYGTMKSYNL